MGNPHPTWCRHRTPFGPEHPTCQAGVDYAPFSADRSDERPCYGENDAAKARCDKYAGWSAKEVAAHGARMDARLRRIGLIRKAIVSEADSKNIAGGIIACPCCKEGRVRWSRARSNGHIHARCSTPDCAGWME